MPGEICKIQCFMLNCTKLHRMAHLRKVAQIQKLRPAFVSVDRVYHNDLYLERQQYCQCHIMFAVYMVYVLCPGMLPGTSLNIHCFCVLSLVLPSLVTQMFVCGLALPIYKKARLRRLRAPVIICGSSNFSINKRV